MTLSIANYNTFIYLISFFREVCRHNANNGCDPARTGKLFFTLLLLNMENPLKDFFFLLVITLHLWNPFGYLGTGMY